MLSVNVSTHMCLCAAIFTSEPFESLSGSFV